MTSIPRPILPPVSGTWSFPDTQQNSISKKEMLERKAVLLSEIQTSKQFVTSRLPLGFHLHVIFSICGVKQANQKITDILEKFLPSDQDHSPEVNLKDTWDMASEAIEKTIIDEHVKSARVKSQDLLTLTQSVYLTGHLCIAKFSAYCYYFFLAPGISKIFLTLLDSVLQEAKNVLSISENGFLLESKKIIHKLLDQYKTNVCRTDLPEQDLKAQIKRDFLQTLSNNEFFDDLLTKSLDNIRKDINFKNLFEIIFTELGNGPYFSQQLAYIVLLPIKFILTSDLLTNWLEKFVDVILVTSVPIYKKDLDQSFQCEPVADYDGASCFGLFDAICHLFHTKQHIEYFFTTYFSHDEQNVLKTIIKKNNGQYQPAISAQPCKCSFYKDLLPLDKILCNDDFMIKAKFWEIPTLEEMNLEDSIQAVSKNINYLVSSIFDENITASNDSWPGFCAFHLFQYTVSPLLKTIMNSSIGTESNRVKNIYSNPLILLQVENTLYKVVANVYRKTIFNILEKQNPNLVFSAKKSPSEIRRKIIEKYEEALSTKNLPKISKLLKTEKIERPSNQALKDIEKEYKTFCSRTQQLLQSLEKYLPEDLYTEYQKKLALPMIPSGIDPINIADLEQIVEKVKTHPAFIKETFKETFIAEKIPEDQDLDDAVKQRLHLIFSQNHNSNYSFLLQELNKYSKLLEKYPNEIPSKEKQDCDQYKKSLASYYTSLRKDVSTLFENNNDNLVKARYSCILKTLDEAFECILLDSASGINQALELLNRIKIDERSIFINQLRTYTRLIIDPYASKLISGQNIKTLRDIEAKFRTEIQKVLSDTNDSGFKKIKNILQNKVVLTEENFKELEKYTDDILQKLYVLFSYDNVPKTSKDRYSSLIVKCKELKNILVRHVSSDKSQIQQLLGNIEHTKQTLTPTTFTNRNLIKVYTRSNLLPNALSIAVLGRGIFTTVPASLLNWYCYVNYNQDAFAIISDALSDSTPTVVKEKATKTFKWARNFIPKKYLGYLSSAYSVAGKSTSFALKTFDQITSDLSSTLLETTKGSLYKNRLADEVDKHIADFVPEKDSSFYTDENFQELANLLENIFFPKYTENRL